MAIIEAKDLRKRYGGRTAVDGVTFAVEKGEIFGILGRNGAGKSTTLGMITGLRAPDGGAARVLNLDPQRQGLALRRRIGVQLQEAALPERIKVEEALRLFAAFYPKPADWRRLLEAWGLAEKRRATFASLSGGMKQRVFIALALINDPEIVFLDELTTGLDPQARRQTWELVRAIRASGKTVAMATHFMDEAEQLCDRVAVFRDGKLAALDTPAALIERSGCESQARFTSPAEIGTFASLSGVTRVVREGPQLCVYGHGSLLTQVAARLAKIGENPEDLTCRRPALEDAFLALTGTD